MYTYTRTYRGPLRAAVFDLAGTTVDFGSRAPAGVFVALFAGEGIEISLDQARGPMGVAKREHIRSLIQEPTIAARWQMVHGERPTLTDVDRMYERFIPMQIEVLPDYAELIPGVLEVTAWLRERGVAIGVNTGYNRAMLEVVLSAAKEQGFCPDSSVSAEDVPTGRPAPWMAVRNAMELDAYPLQACIKVDDTAPGIAEGLNAGMWTVAVTQSGNALGLSKEETAALPADMLTARLEAAHRSLASTGAHYVIDGVWDMKGVIKDIETRLTRGERP